MRLKRDVWAIGACSQLQRWSSASIRAGLTGKSTGRGQGHKHAVEGLTTNQKVIIEEKWVTTPSQGCGTPLPFFETYFKKLVFVIFLSGRVRFVRKYKNIILVQTFHVCVLTVL